MRVNQTSVTPGMIYVRFSGPPIKTTVIGAATGRVYGAKKHGDRLHVHKLDLDAEPDRFTRI